MAKTVKKQRDELLTAVLAFIDARNNHASVGEFQDVQLAEVRMKQLAFELEHEMHKTSRGHKS